MFCTYSYQVLFVYLSVVHSLSTLLFALKSSFCTLELSKAFSVHTSKKKLEKRFKSNITAFLVT
jgi:hypothetical protein